MEINMITTTVETISPEYAAQIWERRNESNRRLSKVAIQKYANDMLSGRWKLGGQGIIIDSNGQLTDGHHRIVACMNAKVAFQTIVVRGVDPESVEVLDTGLARLASHVAQMRGIPYASLACAAARYCIVHAKHGVDKIQSSALHPSNAEIISFVADNERLQLACRTGERVKSLMSQALAAFLFYQFDSLDPAMAESFFDAVGSGINLSEGSAVLLLRKRLQENRASRRARLDNVYIAALVIKAWNAFIQGRPLRVLKWSLEPPISEPFPKIEVPRRR
jgi:hypothetical protein